MTEAYAWSFKGLDHETRDVARAAARRSGKSLTDWLDDVILEKADTDLRPAPRRDEEDDGAEISARRRPLRSARVLGRPERERRSRSDAPLRADPVETPRPRPAEDRLRESEHGVRAPRRDDERREARAIVDDAVALFERRAAESERKTAKALENLADLIETNHKTRARLGDDLGAVIDRLGRIEHKIARRAEEDNARPIREALSRLETRMEELAKEERSVELETAIETFDRRLADISDRLDAETEARARAAEAARQGAARQDATRQEAVEAARRESRERLRRPAPAAAAPKRPLADAVAEISERQRVLDARAEAPAPREPQQAPQDTAARFADLAGSIDTLSQQIASTRFDQNTQDERRQAAVAAQIDQLRRELDGVGRVLVDLAPRASVTAIEAALRDLSERVEAQRHYGVEDNILAPVERLTADLHAMIRDLDPSRMVRSLYDEVRTLGARLAERRSEGGADRETLEEVASETREIRDLLKTVAQRPLPFDRLEAGLAALTRRVDELSSAGADTAGACDLGELVSAIRSTVATETYGYFQTLERRLEEVAAKIDAVSTKSGGGKRFDEINERIERVHKSLAARIDRSGGAGAGQLEGMVTELAKKIDAAIDARTTQPAFDELGRKIERLEERLQPKPEKAAEDEQFRELAKRIDLLHEQLAARRDDDSRRRVDGAAQLTDLVGQLAKKMDAALERRAVADKTNGIEQFRELTERMDRLHEQVSTRVEEETRRRVDGATAHMTDLVAQLAQKMDAALDPTADRAAFSALERQIGRLAERIDHTDQTVSSFSTLETAIGQLMARVEETRGAAARGAETAAREAAQVAVQEALRAANAPTALQKALEKELVDLRQMQDETGHRTNETLSAVHETLQRVVDRLAVFEDELTDIRKSRVAPQPAPTPAPRAEPRVEQKRKREPAEIEDVLVEPSDRRQRRAARREGEPASSVQADFIAAARRAAQLAAADAETAAAKERVGRKSAAPLSEREPARAATAGAMGAVGAVLQTRRRPILLGLGALVLLYGAYQIARVSLDAPASHQSSAVRMEPSAATTSEPAAKEEAPRDTAASVAPAPVDAEPAPAPAASSAAPAAKFPLTPGTPATGVFVAPPGKLGAGAVDPTPTGTIGAASAGAALLPMRDALATIRDLASSGDAAAQFELGSRYADGRGVGRDAKAAFQWIQKSAEQGLAPAQYRLGSFYEKGLGVDRDYVQARGWYQRAAQAGNARAMHNLAVLHAEGGDGKPDFAQAAEWFQKAAEYGVRDSQFNLAILYARGLGVAQSLEQSYVWFAAAAAQGDEDAAKKRDEVKAKLDAKSFAAAKAKAESFTPKQPDKAANDVPPPPGGWENVKPAKPDVKPAKAKVSAR
ncbi:SEL1-like repeat protein [Methylosinus trichosporium]|nr:SEL1-like repeat protein [Methylosinus trichosporium]